MFVHKIENFDDAKEYCRRFRPVLPVAYSGARSNAQPTPSNDPNAERQNEPIDNEEEKFDLPTVQMDAIDTEALNDIMADESERSSADCNISNQNNSHIFETTDMDDIESCTNYSSGAEYEGFVGNENSDEAQNGQVNELITLVETQQTECEIVLSDTVQNDNIVANANSSGNDNDLNRPQNPAKGVKMVKMDNGQIQVTQTLYDDDGEIEMTYIQGQDLRPKKRDKYQMKVNDALSGNLPFQENVCN